MIIIPTLHYIIHAGRICINIKIRVKYLSLRFCENDVFTHACVLDTTILTTYSY